MTSASDPRVHGEGGTFSIGCPATLISFHMMGVSMEDVEAEASEVGGAKGAGESNKLHFPHYDGPLGEYDALRVPTER